MADLDLYSGVTLKSILPPAALTQTTTSSAVDISGLTGKALVILDSAAGGSGATMNVKIQHCTTSGGQYSDVTGAAFTEVGNAASLQAISLNVDECHKYIKAVATIGGSASFTCALHLGARVPFI